MRVALRAAPWFLAVLLAACGAGEATTTAPPQSIPQESTTTTLAPDQARDLVERQYDALIPVAEEIRGLEFRAGAPELVFVSDSQITPIVLDDTLRIDVLEGMGFGAIGATGQIFQYRPEADEVLMVNPRTELTPFGRAEIIEALVLALTYDHFPLDAGLEGEERIGSLGLRHGDAAFHRNEYINSWLTSTERFALRLEGVRQQEAEMILPSYATTFENIGDEVALVLVTDLISDRGVQALDAAYSKPPVSSEQLFRPETYRAGIEAEEVTYPGAVGSGVLESETGVMGEMWFRALFSHSLTDAEMLQATTGWDGDTYTVWERRDEKALSSLVKLASEQDAIELRDGLSHWALNAFALAAGRTDHKGVVFEGSGYVYVAQVEDEVLFVASPDRLLGEKIREQFWPRY